MSMPGKTTALRETLVALCVAAMAIFGAAPAVARAPVIDEVVIRQSLEGTVIHITFNTVLRYQAHTPKSTGNILVIDLRPVFSAGTTADLNVVERRTFAGSRARPLSEVRFEGNLPTAPRLALTFVRPVTFRVEAASDLRSLDVILEKYAAARPPPPAASTGGKPSAPAPRTPPAPAARAVPAGSYVLNLASQPKQFSRAGVPDVPLFRRYRLYSYAFRKDGQTWYRLRLGFFETEAAAREIKKALPRDYADAWIARAGPEERRASAEALIFPDQPSRPAARPAPDRPTLPAVSADRLTRIWEDAQKAMLDGDFSRAVQLYTKLLQLPKHRYTQQAQEFLGLARERKGQLAHAKAEYERYLELYPAGEGTDRVRQRLAGIVTARSAPNEKLRRTARAEDKSGWETELYGSFAQFYTHRATVIDPNGRRTTQSDLLSDLDFTVRARNDHQDVRAVFVGGHGFNFLASEDLNESRVSALYVDGVDDKLGISGRFGRQTRNSSGILGRFDGGYAGYRISPGLKLNVTAGLPVDTTTKLNIDQDRYFYGASADIGPYWDGLSLNIFAIEQTVNGINDRRAVGGEARYLRGGLSVFGLVDYDINYRAFNIALANASYRMADETTLTVAADVRKSPVLTTTNALQGQTVGSISQLLGLYSESEIRRFAWDRTAFSQSYTVGISRPLDTRFQISGDITVTKLSDTDASGGVPVSPGTGYEVFYGAQLVGTGLFSESDVSIFGLRLADTDRSKTVTADANIRYAMDDKWRLNPRLRADYRFNNDDGGRRYRVRPSMRVDYRVRKWAHLEFEGGGEWGNEKFDVNTTDPTADSLTTAEWFVTAGYRVDF